MKNQAQTELLRMLGCGPLSGAETFRRPAGLLTESALTGEAFLPVTYSTGISRLREQLTRDPQAVLNHAPALLGSRPSVTDALRTLDIADLALRSPRETLRTLANNRGADTPTNIFEIARHESLGDIVIDPEIRKFEPVADAAAWALTAVEAWYFRLNNPKPQFPVHGTLDAFRYPLASNDSGTSIALFSDWGTGYYHSQYVTKHIGERRPGQAVHLGDVYYTGKRSEFDERFTPILQKYLIANVPFFAMNANHEMDHNGVSYLQFLEWKAQPRPGQITQPQEASYFCLTNSHYQVIGVDTAYDKNGRLMNASAPWLEHQLKQGRDAGKINILLSQNEPFAPDGFEEERELLTEDMRELKTMVDLWFWGDEHYAALYGRADDVPFFGSCIGHGGFPYSVRQHSECEVETAPLIWAETDFRLPERPDRGNNGFALLRLSPDRIVLEYIHWFTNKAVATFAFRVSNGKVGLE